jgi:hypothetical protein
MLGATIAKPATFPARCGFKGRSRLFLVLAIEDRCRIIGLVGIAVGHGGLGLQMFLFLG